MTKHMSYGHRGGSLLASLVFATSLGLVAAPGSAQPSPPAPGSAQPQPPPAPGAPAAPGAAEGTPGEGTPGEGTPGEVPPQPPPPQQPPPQQPPPQQPPPQPPPPQPPPPTYGGWGTLAPPPPPPRQIPTPQPGTNADGLPHAQRGHIALDTAGGLNTDGRQRGASTLLEATLPISSSVMLEGVVPFGFVQGAFGNPTLGAHYVGRIMKRMWLTVGGNLGIPLVDERAGSAFVLQSTPRAFWDAHLYYPATVPITVRLDWEVHASIVEVRVQAHPSLWAPTPDKSDTHGAFYHAAELQLGHDIGGGLRLQGVVLGPTRDDYQAALEPFFVLRRELGFLRTALSMPLNEPLGPPFTESFGFKLAAGVHID